MTVPPQASPGQESPPSSPSAPDPQARRRPSADELRDLGRLRRTTKASPEGRRIAGVAGGIARHLDVDPLVVRLVLVVATFFGPTLIIYIAGWLLMPEEGSEESVIQADYRLRNILLWVAAGVAALALIGNVFGGHDMPWLWIGLGIVALVVFGGRDKLVGLRNELSGSGGRSTDGVDLRKQPADGAMAHRTTVDAEAVARVQGLLGHTPPTAPFVPVPPPPPAPARRRGPGLTGVALATAALLCGVLGLVDASGVEVPTSAYPALVLAVLAGYLVLGAFWGRAGGLIALSVIALLALAGTTAGAHVHSFESREIYLQPRAASELQPTYRFDAGQVGIDLSKVPPAQLDGRTLRVTGNLGEISVVVPDGVTVTAAGTVGGPGEVDLFRDKANGIGGSHLAHVREDGKPQLAIEATVDVGSIRIYSPGDPGASGLVHEIGDQVSAPAGGIR